MPAIIEVHTNKRSYTLLDGYASVMWEKGEKLISMEPVCGCWNFVHLHKCIHVV